MSKIQHKHSRNIWRPLNRKSQILVTIAALAVAVFQIYFWHSRLTHQQPPSHNKTSSHLSNERGK
ncbi:hypothetical protein WA1_24515 [Scytonema hofmannii PCC 7110]|uniref:Uncharacterized protein n=1 Tax=Scytonema hofmannii PCC 7110 TaxID=128403 RepID=A0A139X834_9CYAN|nr:hypothetical protein [Scytonema hofmannii]KYC40792.1 hypothetical protein WA1_24515 [Scytonema hofmannii PCC 7110]